MTNIGALNSNPQIVAVPPSLKLLLAIPVLGAPPEEKSSLR